MRNYRTLFLIFVVAASLLSASCSSYGTKLEYKKGKLYYTSNVTEADARKLGDYLDKGGFFSETEERALQLDKAGDTYQMRVSVKEGVDKDPKYEKPFAQIASAVSKNVFGGAKVEVHFTDQYFKTLKVIQMG
ncbi:MAG TPA: hypothetical protein VF791_08455 [Pyrinomonadaceae bacterium]